MPANAVSSFDAVNDGSSLVVTITTFLPAVPTLLTFCCPYRLTPKTRMRGGEEVPHGNLLYLNCEPKRFDPTGGDGLTSFVWTVPNANYLPCKDCHLAIVEFGLAHPLDWTTQVHPCPPVPETAVYFDGTAYATCDALVCPASPVISWSYFARPHQGEFTTTTTVGNPQGSGDETTYNPFDAAGGGYFCNLRSPEGDFHNPSYGSRVQGYDGGTTPDDIWHHYLVTVDASAPLDADKLCVIAIDGVVVFSGNFFPPVGSNPGAFNISLAGLPFWIGYDGFGTPSWSGDLASFWYAPGQSLLTAGTIDPMTIALFLAPDGTPRDLGPDGALPTGTAPAIFGKGGPTEFLQPNLGTGGDFTIHGTLIPSTSPPVIGT